MVSPLQTYRFLLLGVLGFSLVKLAQIYYLEPRSKEMPTNSKNLIYKNTPFNYMNQKETNDKRFQRLTEEEIIKEGEQRVKEAIILDAGEQTRIKKAK
ncbi:unnamed protein product [Blepharisma stoltei]|uniref:Uncharacterized protein n=1 Tax=Blepharisma stoltei TaxID=1481888 RepID=A0AAU9KA37_9CILI|nr:unnamed protein product [Blepharisma stoltei]